MKWLNLGLIRLFEFITLLLYSFFVLTYFSAFLLLPLDAVTLLVRAFGLVGLPALAGLPLAIGVTAYLCYLVYRLPGLVQTVLKGGMELTNAGYAQLRQLEAVAAQINGKPAGASAAA